MTDRDRLIELLENSPQLDAMYGEYDVAADWLLANGVTLQEWIPVKDRLPEENVMVLGFLHTVFESGGHSDLILVMVLRYGLFVPFNCSPIRDGSVTHWMPLPQPPKGE